ncbi:hypothetical protein LEP1GSC086_2019 [Leptospira weilii str. LNT 1234]|nr:hypothetical protein LEP1GSC086_2019 [Leptospira weilii str. LNT 1234]
MKHGLKIYKLPKERSCTRTVAFCYWQLNNRSFFSSSRQVLRYTPTSENFEDGYFNWS